MKISVRHLLAPTTSEPSGRGYYIYTNFRMKLYLELAKFAPVR
jgi:hypothetical protein